MKKQRIVVKIGSSSLTNTTGEIDEKKLSDHVQAIANLRQAGHEVILVSSGSVAAGFSKLGYATRPVTIKGKQAAAAVGQSLLIQTYSEKFQAYDIVPAQILLTRSDFSDRDRYRNAFQTLNELLERNILPIINENDTVSIDELTFGDNDMLSALVSGFMHADQLIILTDINGIYDKNPFVYKDAKKYNEIHHISDEMIAQFDESRSSVGTGGMKSKLLAAQIALSLGVPTFVGSGQGKHKLLEILKREGDGTYIDNHSMASLNTKKQWLKFHSESVGKLYVDHGAEEAIILNGKSLLPPGIFRVKGEFSKGDVVEVYGVHGLLGKGEVNYSSDELKQLMKAREELVSEERSPMVEVIHRNRWVELQNHRRS